MNPEPAPEGALPETFSRPIWDHGGAVDPAVLRFTIGDDWQMDQRLIDADLRVSLAHAAALRRANLLGAADHDHIAAVLEALREEARAGTFRLHAGDEDVHSAVDREVTERVGEAGKQLHLGRSRNEQIATDVLLWLREAAAATRSLLQQLQGAWGGVIESQGTLPIPGYTHLQRAMPSTVADWAAAHRAALKDSEDAVRETERTRRHCPLGSGAGYGVPVALDRAFLAAALGFEAPREPVTHVQHARGRAELAYLTALESVALDLGKLAADLWLFSTTEFRFLRLPEALTTGSSLMPQKRNPDLFELLRAHSRQIATDRGAVRDLIRDLPSGYHRDFQLIKPPLFRAHDRTQAMLGAALQAIARLEFRADVVRAASADPDLHKTARAIERARNGETFRDAYRSESAGS